MYAKTLAPAVGLVDSGELTIAAWSLGNAHPPGFPLYLLLTHFFTMLPLGSIAVRVNAASAVCAALACAMTSLAAGELLTTTTLRKSRKGEPHLRDMTVALLSAFAGLLLAFSRTLWAYATIAEVYALNTALLATIVWLMLAWRRRVLSGDARADRWLYAAAIVFGLALGVHHVTIGLTLAGLAALVIGTSGFAFFRSRRIAIAAAVSIAALLLVYAYLPLAARRQPVMNWGNPDTLQRIVAHVTAKQYRMYVDTSVADVQWPIYTGYALREFGAPSLPLALILAAIGIVALARRDRAACAFLLLVVVADAAWVRVYPIVNDKDAYALPAFVAIVLAATAGAAVILRLLGLARWERLAAALFLAVPLLACANAWRVRDRSRFDVGRTFTADALRVMRPHALLLTGNWQLYSPLAYYLDVEHERPDVTAIETGLLIRSWYVDALVRRHPELMQPVRAQLDAYRPLLRRWEDSTPAEWAANDAVRVEFFARVNDLIAAIVEQAVRNGDAVYATSDFALTQEDVLQPLIRGLAARYDLVPRGVVLEYAPHGTAPRLTMPQLHARALLAATYDADDVVPTEVMPTYRDAYLMLGRYFGVNGRRAEAITAFREAVALDPANVLVRRELDAAEAGLR